MKNQKRNKLEATGTSAPGPGPACTLLALCGWRAHPDRGLVVTEPKIKAVKDYAQRGYASVAAVIKPWTVYIDRKQLVDKSDRPRRFASERAALAAARRSIA